MSGPELKMWLVVRRDIPMSRGKVLAQAGHAYGQLYRYLTLMQPGLMMAYLECNQPKVTVTARDEARLAQVARTCAAAGIPHILVCDAGRSELEPNTPTVVAFGPCLRDELPSVLARLQLMKDDQ